MKDPLGGGLQDDNISLASHNTLLEIKWGNEEPIRLHHELSMNGYP